MFGLFLKGCSRLWKHKFQTKKMCAISDTTESVVYKSQIAWRISAYLMTREEGGRTGALLICFNGENALKKMHRTTFKYKSCKEPSLQFFYAWVLHTDFRFIFLGCYFSLKNIHWMWCSHFMLIFRGPVVRTWYASSAKYQLGAIPLINTDTSLVLLGHALASTALVEPGPMRTLFIVTNRVLPKTLLNNWERLFLTLFSCKAVAHADLCASFIICVDNGCFIFVVCLHLIFPLVLGD